MDTPARAGFVIDNGTFNTLMIDPREDSNGGYGVQFSVIRDFDVAVRVAKELSCAILSTVWAWAKLYTDTPTSWASTRADVAPAIWSVQRINSYK